MSKSFCTRTKRLLQISKRLYTSDKGAPAKIGAPLHKNERTSINVQVLSHMNKTASIKVEATSFLDKTASTKVEAPLHKCKSAPTNI